MTKVNFVPKPGKPHFSIRKVLSRVDGESYTFWHNLPGPITGLFLYGRFYYPTLYKTPGEVARALHNINRTKRVIRTLDAIGNNHD